LDVNIVQQQSRPYNAAALHACCRVGERLVLGDANVSTMGAGDLNAANRCAREMVYRCGFSAKLGPVSLMDQEEVYLGQGDRYSLSMRSHNLLKDVSIPANWHCREIEILQC
jgi:ATP-dependent Zn protease